MQIDKNKILKKICYTYLVYSRIKKKLSIDLSNKEIENFIYEIIAETPIDSFKKIGKNFYVHNESKGVRVTINSNTTRIITVDRTI